MQFRNNNLSVIAFANGWTLWHYIDMKAKYEDLDLDVFFNPIHKLCGIGDKICIGLSDCYLEAVAVEVKNQNVRCKEILKVYYE